MNSHKRETPSVVWLEGDAIDQLIYKALLNDVAQAKPSPLIWENICQRIAATDDFGHKENSISALSLWRSILIYFHEFLYDRSWETRLEKRRPLFFWPVHAWVVTVT